MICVLLGHEYLAFREHASFVELHSRAEMPSLWERCLVRSRRRVKNYSLLGLRSRTSQTLCVDERVSNPRHECYSRPKIQHILVRKEVALPLTPNGCEGGYYIRWILESALFYDGSAPLSHILCLPELCFDQLLSISYWLVQSPAFKRTPVHIYHVKASSTLFFPFTSPCLFAVFFFTRFIFYIYFFLFQLSLSSSYLLPCSTGWHFSLSFSRFRSCTMIYTILYYTTLFSERSGSTLNRPRPLLSYLKLMFHSLSHNLTIF